MADKEIIVQGKTVQKALEMARQILQVEDEDLQVEILEPGRRGFFGIFKKPAKIRVSMRSNEKSQRDEGDEEEADGTAGIKGGRLYITSPRGKGRPATIVSTDGIRLLYYDIPVKSSRELRSADGVELKPVTEVRQPSLVVKVAPDGLEATITVSPQVTVSHELPDHEPQRVLQITTKCREERLPVYNEIQLEAALAKKKIVFGLDYQALQRAAALADSQPVVVARGEPAQEGRDGFVEYFFPHEPLPVSFDKEERINFWEQYVFPSVHEGEILAELHPPEEGKPGKSVSGEMIPPRPVKPAVLRIKDGVALNDDGTKAIAVKSGRPVLQGYRKPSLRVVEFMVHPGDVDIKSGNLHFRGDIIILGDVHEGHQVIAHGDITVFGKAEGALLLAGGSVFCRGKLIRCQVKASGMQVFYNRLAPQLEALGALIGSLFDEMQVLEQQLTFRKGSTTEQDRQKLLALLLIRHKKEIGTLAEDYTATLKEAEIPIPSMVWKLVSGVRGLVNDAGKEEIDPQELVSLVQKKEEIDNILNSLPYQPGDIFCSYAQICTLEASGSVIIEGQGCFSTRIVTGMMVRVPEVCRGGEIIAKEGIMIGEIGSTGSGTTRLRVAPTGAIFLYQVYPEVIIELGHKSYVLEENATNVKVSLTPHGQLVVSKSGNSFLV